MSTDRASNISLHLVVFLLHYSLRVSCCAWCLSLVECRLMNAVSVVAKSLLRVKLHDSTWHRVHMCVHVCGGVSVCDLEANLVPCDYSIRALEKAVGCKEDVTHLTHPSSCCPRQPHTHTQPHTATVGGFIPWWCSRFDTLPKTSTQGEGRETQKRLSLHKSLCQCLLSV